MNKPIYTQETLDYIEKLYHILLFQVENPPYTLCTNEGQAVINSVHAWYLNTTKTIITMMKNLYKPNNTKVTDLFAPEDFVDPNEVRTFLPLLQELLLSECPDAYPDIDFYDNFDPDYENIDKEEEEEETKFEPWVTCNEIDWDEDL